MTTMEGSHEDGNSLVRVRAQVMTRDDSTGLWVPMGTGGFSHVSVSKGTSEEGTVEYLIYGRRIADQTVVLSCSIKRDFQYNKVMPTFHHWRTGDKKFGLTFQTAADARGFDKGVRLAIQDLSDGINDFPNFHESDLGEDDVFMALDLPVDSRSSSTSSSFSGSSLRPSGVGTPHHHYTADPTSSAFNHQHLHRLSFNQRPNLNGYVPDPTCARAMDKTGVEETSSYVQLSKGHHKGYHNKGVGGITNDYSYPSMDAFSVRKPGDSATKRAMADLLGTQPPPRLPVKAKKKRKEGRKGIGLKETQCRYCLEMYSPDDSSYCEYAPDRVRNCMATASCLSCAQCVLYHCVADAEGDTRHTGKRWTVLALLSLLMPCLWCYLPCRACHKCGVKCGLCGGRHEPA